MLLNRIERCYIPRNQRFEIVASEVPQAFLFYLRTIHSQRESPLVLSFF